METGEAVMHPNRPDPAALELPSATNASSVRWRGIVLFVTLACSISWAIWLGLGDLGAGKGRAHTEQRVVVAPLRGDLATIRAEFPVRRECPDDWCLAAHRCGLVSYVGA
jgi:hypothetical protein